MSESITPTICPARPGDENTIFGFIQALAAYENLADTVTGTPAQLHQHLFMPPVNAQAWLVEWGGEPVGYGLGFPFINGLNRGLYLEDLYISPAFRRRGLGQALLAFLANLTLEQGGNAMQWTVLAENTPAIQFYQQLGATIPPQARVGRMTGEVLIWLGQQSLGDDDLLGSLETITATENSAFNSVAPAWSQSAIPSSEIWGWPGQPGSIRTYVSYSTFLTQPGLFVADRVGFGNSTPLARTLAEKGLRDLAQVCCIRNYQRLEWVVNLEEADPWLATGLGVEVLPDWRFCYLTGAALTTLAARSQDCGSIR
ncbi:GNAT family N-acetyltransferase [Synechococcus sp. PCC 6312]|uniref:GNAT family N-acetyltransferase n=1 Tax=Synechococcus sp. (strain ATCC 27167 / PCC 6312) TaxID=195253 RepID=UPI00029F314E|nr:GNAT family N-acetyltransferase [Synechococcus sp. PCC 6312]AFY59516.1 acetyltransferase [Synechococcus sp. PCC 6312]